MQAIVTKFLCPTNTRGARINARVEAGSVTIGWNHALNVEDNHQQACAALVNKLGWHYGAWIGGSLPGGGYAWTCTTDVSPRMQP